MTTATPAAAPHAHRRLARALLVLLASGCSSTEVSSVPMSTSNGFTLTSAAFEEGAPIPVEHGCDGEDVSPPLAWSGAPDGTQAYALIVDDPDARGFVHWVLADIPGDTTELPEGEGDAIGTAGRNDFGRMGWGGPCPPSGEHRYVFTLYALPERLGLAGTVDAAALRTAAEGRILGEARLTGSYRRGG